MIYVIERYAVCIVIEWFCINIPLWFSLHLHSNDEGTSLRLDHVEIPRSYRKYDARFVRTGLNSGTTSFLYLIYLKVVSLMLCFFVYFNLFLTVYIMLCLLISFVCMYCFFGFFVKVWKHVIPYLFYDQIWNEFCSYIFTCVIVRSTWQNNIDVVKCRALY